MKATKWIILLCLFGMVGMGADAYDFESDGIYYNITSSIDLTCSVTGLNTFYHSYSGSVTIPSSVSYNGKTYSVTSIDHEAFFGSSLSSVTIGNSVTSIDGMAFGDCSSLTSVTIGNSVTYIGGSAFGGCRSLTSLTIPSSVTNIDQDAFVGCRSLTSIVVNNDNPVYDSRNGCNAIIETASGTLITGCQRTIIPGSVTNIGDYAFEGCSNLASVTIPNSVTSIGGYAFYGCTSLTSVTIPNSVTSIGDGAFSYCSSLPVVDNIRYADTYAIEAVDKTQSTYRIKNGTKWIGSSAFYGCRNLTSLTIPGSVTSIGIDAFYNCSSLPVVDNIRYADTYAIEAVDKKQSTYKIKNGTKWIGSRAFSGCSSLTSLTIPGSVASIGYFAFMDCGSLTSVTIPYSVTSIGGYAFQGCSSLTSVTIPESVTVIPYYCFSGCSSLTSVIIPNSVTSIGGSAFSGCSSLTSVTIPVSVTGIGENPFSDCRSLTSIVVNNDNPVYDSRNDCNAIIETATRTLIAGCQKTIIPGSVTSIDDRAFLGCSSLTSVTIPNSVTSIGGYAFYGCSSLTSVTIPNSVTSIGGYAFMKCSSLTSVIIPNTVISVGGSAFYGCSSLTSVIISSSVTHIGDHAFSDCRNLTSVVSFIREPPALEYFFPNQINCVLKVPAGTREAYIAQGWSEDIFRGGIVEMTPQEITLVDGAAFGNDEEEFYDEINYTRTFNNTKWQSLYVPFEILITEELLEEFEFAYINAARQYDYDDDGEIDNLTIEIFKVKSGTLRANHPYLIRAKVAGEKTITVNEATLYATVENSIDCSTTSLKFIFTGGYQTLGYDDIGGCYLLGGGTWNEVKEGGTMKPMRFYLKIESRGSGQVIPASAAAKPIRMTVFGEDDEVTVVQSPLLQEGAGEAPVFDLQGRRVEHPEKGIYIINGKKVIVK